ncbi:unnamed protein product, partial [Ectocarpus sp. 4 AP-2014]
SRGSSLEKKDRLETWPAPFLPRPPRTCSETMRVLSNSPLKFGLFGWWRGYRRGGRASILGLARDGTAAGRPATVTAADGWRGQQGRQERQHCSGAGREAGALSPGV